MNRLTEMSFSVRFDREIAENGNYYIKPGSYEAELNGKAYPFDFIFLDDDIESEREDASVIGFSVETPDPDILKAENATQITEEVLLDTGLKWNKFFIYTGESEEGELEANPVEITSLNFYFENGVTLEADERMLEKVNAVLTN